MRKLYHDNGQQVHLGDKVKFRTGETALVSYIRDNDKPSLKVSVVALDATPLGEFYHQVFGLVVTGE